MRTEELGFLEPLPLINAGNLEIFFLGTGSAFATKRFNTSMIIIKGKAHVLVDFGADGKISLQEVAHLKPTDIRCVLPTHSHADHVGGLECLALTNRYVGMKILQQPKIKMIIGREYQRVLWDNTLRGGLECNEEGVADKRKMTLGDLFEVINPDWKCYQPREIFEIDYEGIHLEIFRTVHIPEQAQDWEAAFLSYGLFIDGRVFYSGDTKFDPELIEFYADRSEIMFHDVQFFAGAVHAPLADLKTLPATIKSKILLMHYGDNFAEQDVTDFAGFAQQGIRYIF